MDEITCFNYLQFQISLFCDYGDQSQLTIDRQSMHVLWNSMSYGLNILIRAKYECKGKENPLSIAQNYHGALETLTHERVVDDEKIVALLNGICTTMKTTNYLSQFSTTCTLILVGKCGIFCGSTYLRLFACNVAVCEQRSIVFSLWLIPPTMALPSNAPETFAQKFFPDNDLMKFCGPKCGVVNETGFVKLVKLAFILKHRNFMWSSFLTI